MGIYDRDYYRREGPSFLGSFVERGTICKWLIGVNVVCFLIQNFTMGVDAAGRSGESPFTEYLQLTPLDVVHGQVWRLLTYAFLHAGLYHIFFNMLFLWWFGNEMEELLGPREFLCFYLLSALLGGVFYTLTMIAFDNPCIGASGAVMAIMVLFACHYPRRIIMLFFIIPIPIWVLVALYVGQDLYQFWTHQGGQVAVQVHLAGAGFGFAYFKLQLRLTGWLPSFQRWKRRKQATRLRVYHPEDPPSPAPVPVPIPANATTTFEEEQFEARMDAVLEKISRVGKENLTDSERQLLIRASEIYRRRHP